MDNDVSGFLATIQELLPPRTTEYRAGTLPIEDRDLTGHDLEEPPTEPLRVPGAAASPETS